MNTTMMLILVMAGWGAMWILVTGILSLAGGWYSLAKSYRPPERSMGPGNVYTFQSVTIGLLGNYRSCVKVAIHDEGIIMRPIVLYHFMHGPVFIPWSGMADAGRSDFLMFSGVAFRAGKRNITLRGKSAQEVLKRLGIE